ncbi:Fc.00g046000.m01.CDS01 [Cosmosporella sp. VM-42]
MASSLCSVLDREKPLIASTTDSTSTSTRVPSVLGPADGEVREKSDEDKTILKGELEEAKENNYPTGFNFAIIAIIATAIPKITDEFHGLDKVSWYGSAFFLTNGAFQSAWGKAYKYFPLKWTFVSSILIFELGSLICGAAPNATALIVGRLSLDWETPIFTGFVGVAGGVAAVVGPLLGGVFAEKATWRWCFYINLPIGRLSALGIIFFFRTPSAAKTIQATWREKCVQMDPVGVIMMMGALVCFILALQYGGQTMPWSSSTVIGLLIGCILIFIAFGAWEAFQGERAMIVPRLVKQRSIGLSTLFAFFVSGGYFVIIYYLPIFV